MKRRRILGLLLICVSLIMCIAVALIFSLVNGKNIVHYKQYFLPVEGQYIVFEKAIEQPSLSFIFLDEVELSEIVEESNIMGINMLCENGEKIVCTGWAINKSYSFYNGERYWARALTVDFDIYDSAVVKDLEITYPDNTEKFSIGNLNIVFIAENEYNDSVRCLTNFWSFDLELTPKEKGEKMSKPYWNENDKDIMIIVSNGYEFEISCVELGINGLSVFPDNINIQYEDGLSWNTSKFQADPTNGCFADKITVDVLPVQNISILVKEFGDTIINCRLCKTKDYDDYMKAQYYYPLIKCKANGQDFYLITSFQIISPMLNGDDLATHLLEEYGK